MTKKVTLLFPGQGSQYVGMGKNLTDHTLFEEASKLLELPLKDFCFEGPAASLKMTEITQPAILTHSYSLFLQIAPILEQKGIAIERVLGHSVGEYAALVTAGAIRFGDALYAVRRRGQAMQEAVPVGQGKMIALLKVPEESIKQACEASSTDTSKVVPANYNEPNQIVISGHAEACDRAVQWLQENIEEKFRSIELPVSAPFHSPLMEPAADIMGDTLRGIPFRPLEIPYIANIDATEHGKEIDPAEIRKKLILQVCGPVMWTQSIQKLSADTVCLEVGPGKILTNLVKKINPAIKVIPLDTPEGQLELQGL